MDKLQVIQELTEADARLLPEPVRAAIVASVPVPPEVALVAELRNALDLPVTADIKAHLTEMRNTQDRQRQDAIKARVRELVEDAEKGVKLVPLRALVTELVHNRKPATPADVDAIFHEVVNSDSVKAALSARLVETMGPPQGTPIQGQTGKNKYFTIPA